MDARGYQRLRRVARQFDDSPDLEHARSAHGFGDGGTPARRPAITSEPNGPAQARANRRQFSGGCASVDDLRRGSSPERGFLTYGPSQLGLQAHLLRGGSREGHTVTSTRTRRSRVRSLTPGRGRVTNLATTPTLVRGILSNMFCSQLVERRLGLRRIGRQQAKEYNHLFYGNHLHTS